MKNDLKELKKNLKLSWFFVKDQKKYLSIIILISFIMSIVSFIIPLLSAQLLIKLTNGFLKDLLLVVLIIFFIEITRNVLSFFFSRLFEIYSIKATTNVQIKMFITEVLKEILKCLSLVLALIKKNVFMQQIIRL